MASQKTIWIPLEGGEKENYIPGIQWVNEDLLLVQQMNRHQNQLIVWSYKPSNGALKKVYTEKETDAYGFGDRCRSDLPSSSIGRLPKRNRRG